MKNRTLRLAALALASTAVVGLTAGCTTITMNHSDTPASSTNAGAADDDDGGMMDGMMDDANMSDVMFAQMMIPHHEQAVEMSLLAPTNGASPEVLALAEQIAAAQGPEIEQMKQMLDRWGAPAMMEDHSGHGGMAMTGMVSQEDMDRLREAQGPEFDRLFLELMIAHHEGAIAMTEDPLANGEDPELRQLLLDIVEAQTAEIEDMQALLAER